MTPQRHDALRTLAIVAAACALVGNLFLAAWRIDEHYVSRAEFVELRADVRAIARELGVHLPPSVSPTQGR